MTPVDGLFMCGSGTHPGGGVMGAPGHNCAKVLTALYPKKLWKLKFINNKYNIK